MAIGVVLPIEEALEEFVPTPTYSRVLTLALKAEELGFHSIWTGDHLLFRECEMTPTVRRTQGAWESWTILTALAEATSRIRRDEACADVGRDLATLELTVRMFIGFPQAGSMPAILPEGTCIDGKEGAAATLRAYAELGVSLTFCQIYPCNEAALEQLAEGVQMAGV